MIINDRAILLDTGATPSNVSLFNDGPATVSYGASETAVTDGTVASGASLDLPGPRWLKCASGLRADVRIVARTVSPASGFAAWQALTRPSLFGFPALAETMPRAFCSILAATLTSGKLRMVPIYLAAGTVVSGITFVSRNIAAITPTNQWFALYDKNRVLLRQSTDDLTAAWGASASKSLTLSSPVTIPASDIYLLGCMVAAATTPNLSGNDSVSIVNQFDPQYSGNAADTGLTTTAPNPAGAISGAGGTPYAFVT